MSPSPILKLISFVCVIYSVFACNPTSTVFFPPGGAKGIAILRGSFNNVPVNGTVIFEQNSLSEPLRVTVNVSGVQTGSSLKHGFHVHQNGITVVSGDVSATCGSTGSHFNPNNVTHGDISAAVRHVGDYGNVVADANGNIRVTFNDSVSTLYGPFGVIGRTIVLHQLEDDLGLKNDTGSLTTGNAGARIACGVIGVFN